MLLNMGLVYGRIHGKYYKPIIPDDSYALNILLNMVKPRCQTKQAKYISYCCPYFAKCESRVAK